MNTPRNRPAFLIVLAILANLVGVLSAVAAAVIALWKNQTSLPQSEAILLGLLGAFGLLQILASLGLLRLDSSARTLQLVTSGLWLVGCAIAAAKWWGTPQSSLLVVALPGAVLSLLSLAYLSSGQVSTVFDDAGIETRSAPGLAIADITLAGFILLVVHPMMRVSTGRSGQGTTMSVIRSLGAAVEAFAEANDHYPTGHTFAELQQQLCPTYIRRIEWQDAWKNDLRFESWLTPDAWAPDHYAIVSAGKDRKFENRSLLQYVPRVTTDFDCDIVWRDGEFISFPADARMEAAKGPKDPDALFKEATSLYFNNQYDRAIPMFERYVKERPDDALANARLGVSYCNVDRFRDGIPFLQKAIALDKTDYQSRNNLGLAYEKVGKAELGIGPLREALALQPRNAVVNNSLGWVLLRAGRPGEAIGPLELAAHLSPREVQPHYNLALAYKAVGKRDRALQELSVVRKINADSAKDLEAALGK